MAKRFKLPTGESLFANLQALAYEQKRRGVPRAVTAKIEATKKANRKRRQAEATKLWHEKRAAEIKAKRGKFGDRWEDRCVRVMRPGEWYADRDLQTLMGASEDQPVQVAPMRAKLIERRRNPEWRGQNRYGEMQQPKWLYRLTPAGELRRQLCELLD